MGYRSERMRRRPRSLGAAALSLMLVLALLPGVGRADEEPPAPQLSATSPLLDQFGLEAVGLSAVDAALGNWPEESEEPQVEALSIDETNNHDVARLDPERPFYGDAEVARTPLTEGGCCQGAAMWFDPTTSKLLLNKGSVLHLFSEDGELLATRSMPDVRHRSFVDGRLFVLSGAPVSELSTTDLSTVDTLTLPVAPRDIEFLDGKLWLIANDELASFRLSDGQYNSTAVERSPAWSVLTQLAVSPARPDRLIVMFGSGRIVMDVSADPTPVAVLPWGMTEFTHSGQIFITAQGERIEYRADDGSELGRHPARTDANNSFNVIRYDHVADGLVLAIDELGDLVMLRTDGLVATGGDRDTDGRVFEVVVAPGGARAFVLVAQRGVADNARLSHLVVLDLVATILKPTPAFYYPADGNALELTGFGFSRVDTVLINGRERPFEWIANPSPWTGQMPRIRVLTDGTDPAPDASVEIRTDRGDATLHLPSVFDVLARDEALVVLHLDSSDSGDASVNVAVHCDGRSSTYRIAPNGTQAAIVPRYGRCSVTNANPAVRFGFLPDDGPYLPVPDPLRVASFVALGEVHIGVKSSDDRPYWVFINEFGNPPADTSYRLRMICGTWRETLELTGGQTTARFVLPESVRTSPEGCQVELEGEDSAVVQGIAVPRSLGISGSDRVLRVKGFTNRVDYVVYNVDFGGADVWLPHVVGMPGEDIGQASNAGAAMIIPTTGQGLMPGPGSTLTHQARDGLAGAIESNDNFGATSATGDFNGDGWIDIALGAPGEGIGAREDAGAVSVLFGLESGYRGSRSQTLHQNVSGVPGGSEAGDNFGAALAALDFDGDGYDDLAVGAPGEDLGRIRDAGLVHIFYGSPTGLSATGSELVTQNSPGITSAAETDDRFGAVLAGSDQYLAVGSPGEAIGPRKGAGMVHLIDGITYESTALWQGQGAGGKAEPGDGFGSALALTERWLVVGVPDEYIGPVANTGLVHAIRREHRSLEMGAESIIYQNLLEFENSSETDDGFGASISIAEVDEFYTAFLLIGAPGENNGRGIVHIVRLNRDAYEDWNVWTQPAFDSAGDRFGAAVSFGWRGSVNATAPGEFAGAGAVFGTADGANWTATTQSSPGVPGGAEAGDEFGASFSSY